jgi:hypothetical protein
MLRDQNRKSNHKLLKKSPENHEVLVPFDEVSNGKRWIWRYKHLAAVIAIYMILFGILSVAYSFEHKKFPPIWEPVWWITFMFTILFPIAICIPLLKG